MPATYSNIHTTDHSPPANRNAALIMLVPFLSQSNDNVLRRLNSIRLHCIALHCINMYLHRVYVS